MFTRRLGLRLLAVMLFASAPTYAQMDLSYSAPYGFFTGLSVDPVTGEVYVVGAVRPQYSPIPPVTDGSTLPVGQEMGWWVGKMDTNLICPAPDPDNPSLCFGSFPMIASGPVPLYKTARGPNGDLYVAGWGGEAGLTTPGAYNEVDPGGRVMYVVRFSGVDGHKVAFTFFNNVPPLITQPRAIHVGSNGWVMVAGYTQGEIPTTSTAYQSFEVGGGDAFVAIFNQDLSNVGGPDGDGLIYSSILPSGTDLEEGLAVTSDGTGRVWIGGYSSSSDLDTAQFAAGYSSTFQGGTDGFLLQIDIDPVTYAASFPAGTLFGGADDDDIAGLAIDGAGNIVVAGSTASSGLSLQRSLKGGLDAFVAAFTPDGASLLDGTYLGGKEADDGVSVRIDASGNIVTAGTTRSQNFPTLNAYDSSHNSRKKDDVFVTRLDPLFGITDSTFLGGSSHDTCWGLELDANGSAYVGGATASSNFPYNVASTYFHGFVARFDFDTGPPPGNVTVTGFSPTGMDAGTTITGFTIDGTGFVAGATVTFENGNGPTPTASNVVVQSATQIVADVTVGGGGRPGMRFWNVRVTNVDSSTGVSDASTLFTVTK